MPILKAARVAFCVKLLYDTWESDAPHRAAENVDKCGTSHAEIAQRYLALRPALRIACIT